MIAEFESVVKLNLHVAIKQWGNCVKRLLLTVLLSFILVGCSDVYSESDSSPILDKEIVEANAKIGQTKDEEEIFGTEYFAGEGEL